MIIVGGTKQANREKEMCKLLNIIIKLFFIEDFDNY